LPSEKETLAGFLTTWLKEKQKTLRPETYRAYSDRCRLYLIPQLGSRKLARLTIKDIQDAYEKIGEKVCGTTVQHCHGVLRAALQDALRWGLVGRNVAALVTAPRRTTGEMRFLEAEDARDFLEAAHGDDLEALFVLAISSGLREGELMALRRKDVDLGRRQLRVTATLVTAKDGAPVIGEPKTQHSAALSSSAT
jgi:integrase